MARKFSSRHEPRIKNLRWTTTQSTFSSQAAGTAALTFISAGVGQETVMRIRGNIAGWVDGLEAPAPAFLVSIGVIAVPEGTGSTVLWSPFTDDDAPWLYYDQFMLGYEEYVIDVIDNPGLTMYRATVDVKAKRILRSDVELQTVVENTTIISAGSLNASLTVRTLLGEH